MHQISWSEEATIFCTWATFTGWDFYLDTTLSGNSVCQDPSINCYKFQPPPCHNLISNSSVTDCSLNPHKARCEWASQEATHSSGEGGCHLGFSFPHWKTWRSQEAPLGAVLNQSRGRAMWSVCGSSSYPSDAVILGFCAPEVCFSLATMSSQWQITYA